MVVFPFYYSPSSVELLPPLRSSRTIANMVLLLLVVLLLLAGDLRPIDVKVLEVVVGRLRDATGNDGLLTHDAVGPELEASVGLLPPMIPISSVISIGRPHVVADVLVIQRHEPVVGGHLEAVEVLEQLLDLVGPVDVADRVDPVPRGGTAHADDVRPAADEARSAAGHAGALEPVGNRARHRERGARVSCSAQRRRRCRAIDRRARGRLLRLRRRLPPGGAPGLLLLFLTVAASAELTRPEGVGNHGRGQADLAGKYLLVERLQRLFYAGWRTLDPVKRLAIAKR